MVAKDYQLILIIKRAGQNTTNKMYIGEIIAIGNSYFVHLPSVPFRQKVYPISGLAAMHVIDKHDSKIVECELIPNNCESDEQVEYVARIVQPNFKSNDN
jgi:hypothetical protein